MRAFPLPFFFLSLLLLFSCRCISDAVDLLQHLSASTSCLSLRKLAVLLVIGPVRGLTFLGAVPKRHLSAFSPSRSITEPRFCLRQDLAPATLFDTCHLTTPVTAFRPQLQRRHSVLPKRPCPFLRRAIAISSRPADWYNRIPDERNIVGRRAQTRTEVCGEVMMKLPGRFVADLTLPGS
jgi:hypothetical protein